MEYFTATSIGREGKQIIETPVSEEVPLTIEVNDRELATLLSTPQDVENLVTGYFFTSGLISEASQVRSVVIEPGVWRASAHIEGEGPGSEFLFKRVYTTGCGKGVIFHNPLDLINRARIASDFSTSARSIIPMMEAFQGQSEEHTMTRGTHRAVLVSADEIIIFRDDIGRHNTVDKVVGEALCRGITFEDTLLLTSGRISSEILSKALRCRMPVIAALGAPTNQAAKLARQTGLTIAGRGRGSKMMLYNGEERIGQSLYQTGISKGHIQ